MKRFCTICGAEVTGFKSYCDPCRKELHKERSAKYFAKKRREIQGVNDFGNFENFCRWAKKELENVDLKPYLPKKQRNKKK